jgi:hypothetical protein
MALTYQEAKDRLTSMVAATEDPILVDSDLEDLMRLARTTDRYGSAPDAYQVWKPNTTYATNDPIVPTSRGDVGPQSWSSYLYLPPPIPFTASIVWTAQDDGDSGANEPDWPKFTDLTELGGTIVDGGVTWKSTNITPWFGSWNLNHAAAEGWRRKAGKAASGYQFADMGKSLSRQQIFEQCLKMSSHYAQKAVMSLSLSRGYQPYGRLIPGVQTNWDYWE